MTFSSIPPERQPTLAENFDRRNNSRQLTDGLRAHPDPVAPRPRPGCSVDPERARAAALRHCALPTAMLHARHHKTQTLQDEFMGNWSRHDFGYRIGLAKQQGRERAERFGARGGKAAAPGPALLAPRRVEWGPRGGLGGGLPRVWQKRRARESAYLAASEALQGVAATKAAATAAADAPTYELHTRLGEMPDDADMRQPRNAAEYRKILTARIEQIDEKLETGSRLLVERLTGR